MKTRYEDDYMRRKRLRTEHYNQFIGGHVKRTCYACNGSGMYDYGRGKKCGACNGTGMERVSVNHGMVASGD